MKKIAVMPGDGIGKEVIPAALKVLEKVLGGEEWSFTHLPHGADHTLKTGETITDADMQSLRGYDAVLVGALGDPRIPDNHHAKDILLGMRFKLDLYVNFRPSYALTDALVPLKGRGKDDVRLVVFRENTEGLYTGIGGTFKQGSDDEIAIEQEVNTRKGVERILREAFAYAKKRGLKKLVMADKANAMTHGHGLWRRVFAQIAAEHKEIDARALYVDNLVFQLVRDPAQFQVIVSNNLFGDIVTDLTAALQGGLGLAASANYHPGGPAMFEPVHGSAPDIAGKGLANPLGAVSSVALMLNHLGEGARATRVNDAVRRVVEAGVVPRDLGGSASTEQVTTALLEQL
jgi:3-isopropylmalate dehydrogenase